MMSPLLKTTKMIKFFVLSLLFLLISCVSATADSSLCKNYALTFNVQPPVANVKIPENQYSIIFTLGNKINYINYYGEASLDNFSVTMTSPNDLSWIKKASISIEGLSDKVNYPPQIISNEIIFLSRKEIAFKISASSEVIQNYILNEQAQLTYFLGGDIPENTKIINNICFDEQLKR